MCGAVQLLNGAVTALSRIDSAVWCCIAARQSFSPVILLMFVLLFKHTCMHAHAHAQSLHGAGRTSVGVRHKQQAGPWGTKLVPLSIDFRHDAAQQLWPSWVCNYSCGFHLDHALHACMHGMQKQNMHAVAQTCSNLF